MFRDRRFFRAVEAASILVFLDPRAEGSLGFSDVYFSTTACDPVHHVGLQCVRKLVFHSGQRLSEGSLWGEHCSDIEISGDSFDVFTQPFDVWDAHG